MLDKLTTSDRDKDNLRKTLMRAGLVYEDGDGCIRLNSEPFLSTSGYAIPLSITVLKYILDLLNHAGISALGQKKECLNLPRYTCPLKHLAFKGNVSGCELLMKNLLLTSGSTVPVRDCLFAIASRASKLKKTGDVPLGSGCKCHYRTFLKNDWPYCDKKFTSELQTNQNIIQCVFDGVGGAARAGNSSVSRRKSQIDVISSGTVTASGNRIQVAGTDRNLNLIYNTIFWRDWIALRNLLKVALVDASDEEEGKIGDFLGDGLCLMVKSNCVLPHYYNVSGKLHWEDCKCHIYWHCQWYEISDAEDQANDTAFDLAMVSLMSQTENLRVSTLRRIARRHPGLFAMLLQRVAIRRGNISMAVSLISMIKKTESHPATTLGIALHKAILILCHQLAREFHYQNFDPRRWPTRSYYYSEKLLKIIRCLLENGASPMVPDDSGRTALDLAIEFAPIPNSEERQYTGTVQDDVVAVLAEHAGQTIDSSKPRMTYDTEEAYLDSNLRIEYDRLCNELDTPLPVPSDSGAERRGHDPMSSLGSFCDQIENYGCGCGKPEERSGSKPVDSVETLKAEDSDSKTLVNPSKITAKVDLVEGELLQDSKNSSRSNTPKTLASSTNKCSVGNSQAWLSEPMDISD